MAKLNSLGAATIGVQYFDGTSVYTGVAGTTGQALVANTAAAPAFGTLGPSGGGTGTATTFTEGSVIFAGPSGVYTQDNANLFWDNTNNNLGIGTASPQAELNISKSELNGNVAIHVQNTNGGGTTSNSLLQLSVQAAASGDPFIRFDNSGFKTWSLGMDNSSAADDFVLANSIVPGTSDVLVINGTSGAITTGVWNATVIGVTYGGTGTSTTFTQGSVVFAGASGVYSQDNANFFWNDTNNQLLIGSATSSDATIPLEVYASTVAKGIRVFNTGASGSAGGSIIQAIGDDAAAIASGDRIGAFQLGGSLDAAHTLAIPVSISAFATEAWNGTSSGSYLRFETCPNASLTRAERMRIGQDGKIYIGASTNAVNLLDVPAGMAIGSYAGVNTAPSNGLIVSGQVGIAATAPDAAVALQVGSSAVSTPYAIRITSAGTADNSPIYSLFATGNNERVMAIHDTSGHLIFGRGPAGYTDAQLLASATVLLGTTGVSIGSYASSGTAPPSNGMIISGNVAIATSSPDASATFQIAGTNTVTNAGFQYAEVITTTLNPTGGAAGEVRALSSQASFIAPVATTIASAMGVYANANAGSNVGIITSLHGVYVDTGATAGTVTTGYGLRVQALAYGTTRYGIYATDPAGGTAKAALYADNASIGYTATTPPTNGMIITGNVSIGKSTNTYPLDVVGPAQVVGAAGTNNAILYLNPSGAGFVSSVQSEAAAGGTLQLIHNSNVSQKITSVGEVTFPLTPAFLAYLGSTVTNVTGNGTNFQIGTTTALTEVFDQSNDFNTNGTFTAPITGRYHFDTSIYVTGCTIASLCVILISTSNRAYRFVEYRAASALDFPIQLSALADMDAADTAVSIVNVSGEAGDTDDVYGDASANTFFCGSLEC